MSEHKIFLKRVFSLTLIVMGILLGITWNSAKFCIGDLFFSALGLPAWSNGSSGAHYPAIAGSIFLLIGIAILNSTLEKKIRERIGLAIILLLAIWSFVFSWA